MNLKRVAEEITTDLYEMYGSDSGVLFGLPPEYHKTIEGVIQCALEHKGVVIDEAEVFGV